MKHCMERFAKIRLVAMDVDGTLTDGKIYVGPQGEVMKAFHVRDGYRLAQCPQRGIITAIITGRASEIVTYRSRELHISEVYQGVGDKRPVLDELMERYQCAPEEVLYIGDDCNDLTCMEVCGISACPSDATPPCAGRPTMSVPPEAAKALCGKCWICFLMQKRPPPPPQHDITLGERGHPGAHRYPGPVQRQGHLLCGRGLGGQIPRVGQGAP